MKNLDVNSLIIGLVVIVVGFFVYRMFILATEAVDEEIVKSVEEQGTSFGSRVEVTNFRDSSVQRFRSIAEAHRQLAPEAKYNTFYKQIKRYKVFNNYSFKFLT